MSNALAFASAGSVWWWDNVDLCEQSPSGIVTELADRSRRQGANTSDVQPEFSPLKDYLGVSVGFSSAAMEINLGSVDYTRGRLLAWAGDTGLLVMTLEPELVLAPVEPRGRRRVVQGHFKGIVASDPEGRWFAYLSEMADSLAFRGTYGELLRIAKLPFRAQILGTRPSR